VCGTASRSGRRDFTRHAVRWRRPRPRHAASSRQLKPFLGGPLGQARGPASSYPVEPAGSRPRCPIRGAVGDPGGWGPILTAAIAAIAGHGTPTHPGGFRRQSSPFQRGAGSPISLNLPSLFLFRHTWRQPRRVRPKRCARPAELRRSQRSATAPPATYEPAPRP
jgi:hypothetical protein